jgi:hypothetical protein
MASSSPKLHQYEIQDGSLCQVCSEFTFDKLQLGFALPAPKDIILPGRECRLCRFILSKWPRTVHALAETASARPPRLILCPMSGEVLESYSQDLDEKKSRALSATDQMSGLALLTDYNLRKHKFNEKGYEILGKLAASDEKGVTRSHALFIVD